ncbi:hypothetical protein N7466_007168 [Penicillium verhagenii]|uniref:uncharacterized protein n=1 Tax=Penicillium verhagenii TaxID=1562060 RepID=UPI002545B52A|nr:uncharacterized protein N7466_007168 [Penicillium verhagenii]KAJ5928212.1 hypothetical protein N7466_007168 [Penicillium verhagenii]
MTSMLKSYMGFTDPAGERVPQETSPARALPANWYTSKEMYELERRAVFSRKWLLTTHKLRLAKTGDYLKYDIAGFPFIIVRDRDGNINAFHNVCRHRAFPVVADDADSGTTRIFACKYHGWSYGLNGKLAKAPGYQELEGFDKSQNGLFTIHVHVDGNGFIWVNLDSAEKPEISWEEDFKGIDLQPRFQDFDFSEYQFDHTWEMNGDYNWKVLADNYNECYHCQTAHPDVPSVATLEAYDVDTKNASIIHHPGATEEQLAKGMNICSTYYFPNASMTVSPHFFFMQRFVPTTPTSCVMRYEVYRHKDASDEEFDHVNQMFKRIMAEDKELCTRAQANLNNGVFVNGELHPKLEKGPLYFQSVIRDIVVDFHKREEGIGREVWPSRQALPATATTSQEDMDFCTNLTTQKQGADCSTQASGCCGGGCQTAGNQALAY